MTTIRSKPRAFLSRTTPVRQRAGGFSLIELAVVIVVVTLLLGSLLVPLTTQVENRRYSETEKQLEHIREALIGFALANRHLPCPTDSASDGTEDRTGDVCTLRVGFVPWITLGVTRHDAWDNLFQYSVTPSFANRNSNSYFTLNSKGDIRIKTRDGAGAEANLSNAEIPASVLSHGKNGFGATSSTGTIRFKPSGWDNTYDEQINATDDDLVYVRERTENTAAPGGEFDDVVVWVSLNQLFAKMVSAGRLP